MPGTIEIRFPALHESQRMVAEHAARFKVMAAGRRWGKSRLGSALCVAEGLQGRRAWWVAPSYPVATVGWRMIKRLSYQVPGVAVRQGDRTIYFPGDGEVRVRSADNPDSLRGEGLDFVVLDECAFMKEDAWTHALRPALSDRQGRAMFISTPTGRNWFWRLWMRGNDDANVDWQSWQLPTADNPYIDPVEIEAARDSMPANIFRQEYAAAFLENEGAVFRNIAACLYDGKTTPQEHSGHTIVIGVDWGKQNDFTAISAGCLDCRQEVELDRFNQIDYTFQRARLASLVEKWRARVVLPERNSMGDPIIEELIRQGVPVLSGPDDRPGFNTSATTKPPLIENLALTLERSEFQFIDDPVATGELEAYERQESAWTGRPRYSAPDGLHDDTVMARALMMWVAGRSPAPLPDLQPVKRNQWRDLGSKSSAVGRWKL